MSFEPPQGFNQLFKLLAELRNGISTSPSVNRIARMDGEAPIAWIEVVVAR